MIKKVFHIGVVASLMVAVNLAWAGGTELRGLRVVASGEVAKLILQRDVLVPSGFEPGQLLLADGGGDHIELVHVG